MKDLSIDSREFLNPTRKPSGLDKLARKVIRARLKEVAHGSLLISVHKRPEPQNNGASSGGAPGPNGE
jgi:hypothetical protein